jgi:hypothetical protein
MDLLDIIVSSFVIAAASFLVVRILFRGDKLEKHANPTNFEELVLRALNTQNKLIEEVTDELQAISRQLEKIISNTSPIAVKSFNIAQSPH